MSDVNPYQPPRTDAGGGESLLKVYWSLKTIPGLSDLAPRDARALWWKVLPSVLKRWPVWLATLVFLTMPLFAYAAVRLKLPLPWVFTAVPLFGSSVGLLLNQTVIRCAIPFIKAEREAANLAEESS